MLFDKISPVIPKTNNAATEKRSSQMQQHLLLATLVLSLTVNILLGFLNINQPPPCLALGPNDSPPAVDPKTDANAELATDAARDRHSGGPESPLQTWTEEEMQKLLRRAEAAYQAHMKLKAELMGTEQELAAPFDAEVEQAMAKVHPLLKGDWAWPVYRKEYLVVPRYPCFEEQRVGTWGEGGKWLCLISLHKNPEDLVVYSVGSQGDTAFEKGVYDLLQVKSHTFDPFVSFSGKALLRECPYVTYHAYGLSGTQQQRGNLKDLKTIMSELNHTFIDLLKVDCEGCEVEFGKSLKEFSTREKPLFGQLLMEIHNLDDMPSESGLLKNLRDLGFRMFHSEVNFFEPAKVSEVAFIHESLVIPKE